MSVETCDATFSLLPANAVRPIFSSKPPLPIERPLVRARTSRLQLCHLPPQPAGNGKASCISQGEQINMTGTS